MVQRHNTNPTKTKWELAQRHRLQAGEEPNRHGHHFLAKRPKPEPTGLLVPSTIRYRQNGPTVHNGTLPSRNARSSPNTSRDRSRPSAHPGKVANPRLRGAENSNRSCPPPPSCLPTIAASKRHHSRLHLNPNRPRL